MEGKSLVTRTGKAHISARPFTSWRVPSESPVAPTRDPTQQVCGVESVHFNKQPKRFLIQKTITLRLSKQVPELLGLSSVFPETRHPLRTRRWHLIHPCITSQILAQRLVHGGCLTQKCLLKEHTCPFFQSSCEDQRGSIYLLSSFKVLWTLRKKIPTKKTPSG